MRGRLGGSNDKTHFVEFAFEFVEADDGLALVVFGKNVLFELFECVPAFVHDRYVVVDDEVKDAVEAEMRGRVQAWLGRVLSVCVLVRRRVRRRGAR